MNERIKELAEKVGFDLYNEDKENMFQEFAELIIKECVNACEENSWMMLDAYRRSSQIKQHFGVE